jgi:hypothetical protein
VPEPETMNDTCRKTMLMGTVDRGFIACWIKVFKFHW